MALQFSAFSTSIIDVPAPYLNSQTHTCRQTHKNKHTDRQTHTHSHSTRTHTDIVIARYTKTHCSILYAHICIAKSNNQTIYFLTHLSPVWMCGCVNVWMCECVDVWMCGCVNVWMCVRETNMLKMVNQLNQTLVTCFMSLACTVFMCSYPFDHHRLTAEQ